MSAKLDDALLWAVLAFVINYVMMISYYGEESWNFWFHGALFWVVMYYANKVSKMRD